MSLLYGEDGLLTPHTSFCADAAGAVRLAALSHQRVIWVATHGKQFLRERKQVQPSKRFILSLQTPSVSERTAQLTSL